MNSVSEAKLKKGETNNLKCLVPVLTCVKPELNLKLILHKSKTVTWLEKSPSHHLPSQTLITILISLI